MADSDDQKRRGARAKAKAKRVIARRGDKPRRRKYQPRDKAPDDVELFSRAVMACAFAGCAFAVVFGALWMFDLFGSGMRVLLSLCAAAAGYWLGLNRDGWD